ncbi:hypothetical protein [Rhodococcus gannanensis]|uniref:Serine hydrolase n=1 Tax=Rhodococcus gannanensis TaxID=1960308 RepID=A0ABW4P8A5_9NOCA
MSRRRYVAALAVAIGTTIAGTGCAIPSGTTDPYATYHSEEWSDLPAARVPAPIPPSGDSAEGDVPGTGGWTPAATTSGPLPTDLAERVTAARASAAARGADVAVSLLDRTTGDRVVADGDVLVETASVAKIFIADAVFHETTAPSDPDLELIARMLERSDDDAATALWSEHGGSALVDDVVARYGLHATAAPWDGNWWNTTTTPDDLVDYYAGLLGGAGGLTDDAATAIVSRLRAGTPTAADGYDQWFGIPDALDFEVGDVAFKQGWMCCVSGRWVHLSTAVVGPDSRYVLVVVSHETVTYESPTRETTVEDLAAGSDDAGWDSVLPDTSLDPAVDDVSAAHARETLTDVVRIMFPEGRIG